MTNINEMIADLATKRAELADLVKACTAKQAEIDGFEYVSSENDYDEMLDSEGPVYAGGLEFYPSDILKNCDPTAYRCGKNDYDDSFDLNDVEEYTDLLSELEDLEGERDDKEAEIEELAEQIENQDLPQIDF